MSKNAEDKLGDELRALGTILELVALPIFITVNMLRVIPNQDHGVINVLSVVAVLLFFTGLMLHHLPKQGKEEK